MPNESAIAVWRQHVSNLYQASKPKTEAGFPGGSVLKSLPANAGDMGSIPAPGRFRMPRSNEACVPRRLSLGSRACEPGLRSPRATTTEAQEPVLCKEKPLEWEAHVPQLESSPHSLQLVKNPPSKKDPAQPKMNRKIRQGGRWGKDYCQSKILSGLC